MTIMNDLRMHTYHPNYRYDVTLTNIQTGSNAYVKMKKLSIPTLIPLNVTEPLSSIETTDIINGIVIPSGSNIFDSGISITFLENDDMEVSNFFMEWSNAISNPYTGVTLPIRDCVMLLKIKKLSQSGLDLSVGGISLSSNTESAYLVYPKGEISMSYSANNPTPTDVSVNFAIAGFKKPDVSLFSLF